MTRSTSCPSTKKMSAFTHCFIEGRNVFLHFAISLARNAFQRSWPLDQSELAPLIWGRLRVLGIHKVHFFPIPRFPTNVREKCIHGQCKIFKIWRIAHRGSARLKRARLESVLLATTEHSSRTRLAATNAQCASQCVSNRKPIFLLHNKTTVYGDQHHHAFHILSTPALWPKRLSFRVVPCSLRSSAATRRHHRDRPSNSATQSKRANTEHLNGRVCKFYILGQMQNVQAGNASWKQVLASTRPCLQDLKKLSPNS